MNLQRLFATVCLSVGMLAAGVPVAHAQSPTLSEDVIVSPDLSQSQKDLVKQYVDGQKNGMKGSPLEIKKSRNALLDPLRNPKVSVAFRLEYTRQIGPVIRPLLGDKDQVIAANAVRVAGELATATAVEMLTEALKDSRPGVRYAAAAGFENTFKAMQGTVPAINGGQALRMIDTLKEAVKAETDPRVLEGMILALVASGQVPNRQVEGLRDAGLKAMAEAVSAKTADRKVGAGADAAFRRAIVAVRSAVTTNRNLNERDLQADTLRAGAGMAGDLLALVADRLAQAGETADADVMLMVREADASIYFIQPMLAASSTAKEPKMGELLEKGDIAGFRTQVMQIIGPNGILTAAPFGFADNRFVKNP